MSPALSFQNLLPVSNSTEDQPIPSVDEALDSPDMWSIDADEYKAHLDACMTPIRYISNELVTLYFQHVHPFCPVVDEFNFMNLYKTFREEDGVLRYVELILFQAMMFTAFAVSRIAMITAYLI